MKKLKRVKPKLSFRTAGQAYTVDLLKNVANRDDIEELSNLYLIGRVMLYHHGPTKTTIDWERINAAIAQKHGAEYLDALKAQVAHRLEVYALCSKDGLMERTATIAGLALRNQG